jgi:hypothetical protein
MTITTTKQEGSLRHLTQPVLIKDGERCAKKAIRSWRKADELIPAPLARIKLPPSLVHEDASCRSSVSRGEGPKGRHPCIQRARFQGLSKRTDG